MNHAEWQEAIDAYVDGQLDARTRERLLLHLKDCASCREDVASLLRIVSEAKALPSAIEPPSHVWWRVADAIAVPTDSETPRPIVRSVPSRFRFAIGAAGLAAMLWVAVKIAPHGRDTDRVTATAPSEKQPDLFVISNNAEPQPSDWARMIWTLEEESLSAEKAVFTGLSEHLDAQALERASAVEPALQALDIAINETAHAMRLAPENRELVRTLTGYYERKLELLRIAARLASGTWA